mmetsp:Transcript_20247/g.44687  ORF Transcript_20247/g.44687 Transcript_20247/m.44687 type:complete len:262 (-) Transcript_20247:59-844(-)
MLMLVLVLMLVVDVEVIVIMLIVVVIVVVLLLLLRLLLLLGAGREVQVGVGVDVGGGPTLLVVLVGVGVFLEPVDVVGFVEGGEVHIFDFVHLGFLLDFVHYLLGVWIVGGVVVHVVFVLADLLVNHIILESKLLRLLLGHARGDLVKPDLIGVLHQDLLVVAVFELLQVLVRVRVNRFAFFKRILVVHAHVQLGVVQARAVAHKRTVVPASAASAPATSAPAAPVTSASLTSASIIFLVSVLLSRVFLSIFLQVVTNWFI